MLTKRIIPCMDIKNSRIVKGINFETLRDAGDPVELGTYYASCGADELVFLDITATNENRTRQLTDSKLVTNIAGNVNIPFTVGGGIRSAEDVSILLNAGADKISVNTAAVKNPQLLNDLSKYFGSQCIVLSIDAKSENNDWFVYMNGGKVKTKIKATDWAKEAANRGAGEIILTSINHDGTKNGFANTLTRIISESVNIPVIASGGAGTKEHFLRVFSEGKADAALAASVFHYKEIEIQQLKQYLSSNSIPVRL